MKKYIIPTMSISIFGDLTETTDSAAYVEGLKDVPNTNIAQITLQSMQDITKFTF